MIYPHLSEGLLLGHMAFISHQGRAILSTPAGGEGGDKAHESLRKLGTTFAWRNIECDYSSRHYYLILMCILGEINNR